MQLESKIAVIGAGVMGAGIAAQIANSGHKVYLLDIVPSGASDRDILAKNALLKISDKITSKEKEKNIIPGNIEDNIKDISEADWIIEVIIEKLDIKHQLYQKLESVCKKDCIITSNTSTIPLADLILNRSEGFKKKFFITHFFNPPRFMQLVELITSKHNLNEDIKYVSDFLDIQLGKTVIRSNDTPGFIANRIGCYFLQVALHESIKMNLSIEEVDSLLGDPIGLPKTGVFGLYDLIGIDVMELISKSLSKLLPKEDDFHKFSIMPEPVSKMIQNGFLGRKAKKGFYRMNQDSLGNKLLESIDLNTLEYKSSTRVKSPVKGVKDVFDLSDFAKKVLLRTLSYAASIVPETSESVCDIDSAMKLGYNWKFGPFEMIDLISVNHFCSALDQEGIEIPSLLKARKNLYLDKKFLSRNGDYKEINKPEGVVYINEFNNIIYENKAAKYIDLGDGIAGLYITSKMAALDSEVFEAIIYFCKNLYVNYKALVIYGGDPNFSVGGNLKYMLDCANSNNYTAIEGYLKLGQEAMLAIKYSKIPVVSALHGMALGGGMELLLHSHKIVAHIEANAGLVEPGVGLIPSWGGCSQLILKAKSEQDLKSAFKNIMLGNISSSADNLKEMFELDNLSVCMNINRVLANSRKTAADEAPYKSYEAQTMPSNFSELSQDLKLEGHDNVIAQHLSFIFSKANSTEHELMSYEREAFISLLKTEATKDRIRYMLENGKRLKN